MTEGNWREHAAAKEWQKISTWQLSDEDRQELLTILAAQVPLAIWGEGLDTFKDYAPWSELPPGEMADAAYLLESIRGFPYQGKASYPESWLKIARSEAIAVAGEEGIVLIDEDGNPRDFYEIFIFFDRDGWPVELRKDIAEAIIQRRENNFLEVPYLDTDVPNMSEFYKAKAWAQKYPWRWVRKLSRMVRDRSFGINTRLDRALLLYKLCDTMEAEFEAGQVIDMAGFGFEAGRHYEALHWKQYEPAALKGIKLKETENLRAKNAGRKSAASRAARRLSLMAALELVAQRNQDFATNLSILLPIAVKEAASSDVKLWSQGAGQAEEYIGEIRRGEAGEELKARYRALFPEKPSKRSE